MSVMELEKAVTLLPQHELKQFAEWFEKYQQDQWDKQIEDDSNNGRLDDLIEQAHRDFELGRCKAL